MIKKILLSITLGFTLASCTPQSASIKPVDQDTSTSSTQTSETTAIKIIGYNYIPSTITVAPGTVIAIVNDDTVIHTVTSDDGEFDSGEVANGKPGSIIAPSTPGRYPYHCTPHPYMTGAIIVE